MTQAPTPGPLSMPTVDLTDDMLFKIETGETVTWGEIKRRLAPTAPVEASGSERERLAVRFHETYERLAPSFGYQTRDETKAFDPTTPNGRLMIAVCGELLSDLRPQPSGETRSDFTPVVGLWKDQSLSRMERVKAHRFEFDSDVSTAVEAVDEEASRQALLSARPLALGGQHSTPTDFPPDDVLACDTTPVRAEAQPYGLYAACQAVLDDYQTSDAHHPDHVLIRRTDFERIKALVEAPVVVQGAWNLVRQAHEILRSGNPPFSAREVNARGKLRDALNPDRARAEAQDEGSAGERERIARIISPSAFWLETASHNTVFQSDRLPVAREKAFAKADEIIAARAHPSPTPAADEDRVRIAVEALASVIKWGESRCPCYNDLPDPCPLCDASVANLEGCKSAEKTFPPALLGEMRQALAALKSEGE